MKLRAIVCLVAAEVAAMGLWFIASAVLADLARETPLSAVYRAMLASSVQVGFVAGALAVAATGVADRFDPRRVFALAACVAAFANAALLLLPVGGGGWLAMRCLTGFALAGVYPVGMKIAVGWGLADRGLLIGLLVGGLTLGSAAPHLLAWLGGTDWRWTTGVASALALMAAVLVFGSGRGPHHVQAGAFRVRGLAIAWRDLRLRRAFGGYFGHMWELYALWAWMASAVAASYAQRMPPTDAADFAKLTTFAAIAGGALCCPVAGLVADRIGKARLTILVMSISGASALAAAASFGGPVPLVFAVMLCWGVSVIPDSAQFSALIADYAPAELAGSLLTLQTALGFALTVMTVQLTPALAEVAGWQIVFLVMALGPAFGIVSMWRLRGDAPSPR